MVSGTNNKYSGNRDLTLDLTRREEDAIMKRRGGETGV